MGWIPCRAFRIGVGSIATAEQVEEPAGFTGEWVTPCGQLVTKRRPAFRIAREGRPVYATRREAMRHHKEAR